MNSPDSTMYIASRPASHCRQPNYSALLSSSSENVYDEHYHGLPGGVDGGGPGGDCVGLTAGGDCGAAAGRIPPSMSNLILF